MKQNYQNVLSTIYEAVQLSMHHLKCLKHNKNHDHTPVRKFQNEMTDRLKKKLSVKWEIEYKNPKFTARDSVDIHGIVDGEEWIIEIDAARADQIAKKAVSRIALYGTAHKPFHYISILYPATVDSQPCQTLNFQRPREWGMADHRFSRSRISNS